MEFPNHLTREPLAIVGMACRLPGGVTDPESFWQFLCASGNGVTVVPADRWSADRYFCKETGATGKLVTRWGGFTEGIADFDAEFFGISPREAARMDPQQRRLLELTWEALEDARIPPSVLRGSATGVFMGLSNSDYGKIQHDYHERIDGYTNSGNALSIAANRISYLFDLKGPSLVVDTACSSGLVAVNLACVSLWSGESTTALAGASNALLQPDSSLGLSKAGMLSPTGTCQAFDARADGYVRGEGAGVILIKPLARALADGDRIYATILASTVNQDGKTSSLTVPGLASQQAMLLDTLRAAGVPPTRVTYVEAHGTGTPVGDPIEARALGEVLSQGRREGDDCLLGSVKSNIGHLEPAAGLAGIIKAALVVKEGRVPPNLHFTIPNPFIPFDELRLRVVTEMTDLPKPLEGAPLVVVNSFGFGGTNAQALLGPAPVSAVAATLPSPPDRPFLLPLSARTHEALVALAARYVPICRSMDKAAASLCTTVARGRERLEHRLVVMGRDGGALADRLASWSTDPSQAEGIVAANSVPGGGIGPVFVFTGQGAQWWGMGRELLGREPVFRATVAEIDSLLAPLTGWSLLKELSRPESDSRIHETEVAQPALFALQTGLVALWKSWGVNPAAVVGHSVGEVAGACAAGILSLEDSVRLVFHRSRLQGTTRGSGRMAAVGLTVEEARARILGLSDAVEVAAINSPNLVTLAGDNVILESLLAELESEGRFARRLPVDYAFHTGHMDPIRHELLESLKGLSPRDSGIPFFSTVTGDVIAGSGLDEDYWWRNVRDPVAFSPSVERVIDAGHRLFLEIGPHPALAGSIRECLAHHRVPGLVLHSLKRESDESLELARNVAGFHLSDVVPDWEAYHGATADRSLQLPSYPWQRKTFWIESVQGKRKRIAPLAHPLLGIAVDGPSHAWEQIFDTKAFPWLDDHRFWKRIVFPAAAYAEIGLVVGRILHPGAAFAVEDLVFERILFLQPEIPPTLRVEYEEEERRYRVFSRSLDTDIWTLHASGRIVPRTAEKTSHLDLRELRISLEGPVAHWDFYEGLREAGYGFGPGFRQIEKVWHGDALALAEVIVPTVVTEVLAGHFFHASILDACFQTVTAALGDPRGRNASPGQGGIFLPASVGFLQLASETVPPRFWVRARVTSRSEDRIFANLDLLTPQGDSFATLRGFQLDRVGVESEGRPIDDCCYQFRWQTSEDAPASRTDTETREGPSPGSTLSPAGTAASLGESRYLILTDRDGCGAALADALSGFGAEVTTVPAGPSVDEPPDRSLALRWLDQTRAADGKPVIVHLWCFDHPSEENLDPGMLRSAQVTGVGSLLWLAQALEERNMKARVLVALPSQSAGGESGIARLASAPVIGFLRVAAGEVSKVRWSAVLLEPESAEGYGTRLIDELIRNDDESEVVLGNERRHVRRLQRVRPDELPRRVRDTGRPDGSFAPYRIENERPGRLDRIVINETLRREPGEDEVEVRVKAAGINFRDLMKTLGMYPGDPEEAVRLGDDFSGIVIGVGSGVDSLRPGDEVFGLSPSSFQSHVTTSPLLLLRKPASITFAEAATLPTAFLTAHYALRHVGRMRAGESILIHAATGGVGLAAIQVARSLGLEIFATAGTDEKRDLLRAMGIDHVMDSRTLAFADEILETTKGRGVDAVLNSLAGEFFLKSLSVLAPFGRFLEIGKVDLFANRRIGLRALRNSVSFSVIDLQQVITCRPREASEILDEVRMAFESGLYRPLPFTEYPCTEATEAFRLMAQGKHVGKLVLDFESENVPAGRITTKGALFSSDVTYLIAGGTSGYGFETAKWLARNGARHLALLSRTGPADDDVREGIASLMAEGVTVRDTRADLTDTDSVFGAVTSIEREMPPIGGVVQAAMILEDRFLREHDLASFETALLPKVLGTWNLHLATRHRVLDLFLCHSSFSAVAGASRQSNYAAANTFLDEFARYRHSLGLAALSVNWGALSGTGYAERHGKTMAFLKMTGVDDFRAPEAFAILEQLIRVESPNLTAARVDWTALVRLAPGVGKSKLFSAVAAHRKGTSSSAVVRPLLLSAGPEQQREIIEDFLAAQVAAVFGADENTIDRALPVSQLGLDSLMAIELLNRIEHELGIQFPVGSILNGPSIRDLTAPVLEVFLFSSSTAEPTQEEGEPTAETDRD